MPEPRTLVIMVKLPRAGRVKTRLGREMSMVSAAWWYRHQVRRLLRRLRDPRWRIVLAVSPDREGMRASLWPVDLQRIPQGHGDLGERMARGLRFNARGPVCLIGSDIPGVQRHHIAEAFAKLGAQDAVFGPARDGGFWLIGLRLGALAKADMFGATRWSHSETLAEAWAALPFDRVGFVATLSDVDRAADLTQRS